MKKQLFIASRAYSRTTLVLFVLSLLMPIALIKSVAYASGPLGSPATRKITMSNSAGGATDVLYNVQFSTAQGGAASNVNGVVIEFCDDTPIIGTACTAPSGLNTNKNTLSLGTLVGLTNLTVDTTNSTANKVVLTGTNTAVATATAVTIPLGSGALSASHYFTNPTLGNHTFYARILTFTTAAGAQQYTSTNIDNTGANAVVDAGGIALSTANQLQITAKVQERLRFCISTIDSADCTTTGTQKDTDVSGTDRRITALTLGDANGVLDTSGAYVNSTARLYIQTNASSGAAVTLKGDTLANGGNKIAYTPGTSGTGALATTGYVNSNTGSTFFEQFGFCATTDTGVTVAAPYGDGVANQDTNTLCASAPNNSGGAVSVVQSTKYGLDLSGTGVTSASGSTVLTKSAGAVSKLKLSFIGNIANTTKAGIYTTTLQFTATGTY